MMLSWISRILQRCPYVLVRRWEYDWLRKRVELLDARLPPPPVSVGLSPPIVRGTSVVNDGDKIVETRDSMVRP